MRKFIHSSFEIDLSKLKVVDVLENPWFSNKFFAKFTFPFSIELTEENDLNFGFLSHYNANSHTTIYEGKYVHRDVMEDAILEIDEVTDVISMSFGYGFDEFPNFEKKLSELPLDKFEVVNIYAHAKTVISETWPDVNYNFPQIHIDKIDNTQDIWIDFEKIINNYKSGEFLINEVIGDQTYNRNIMQPLPYLLHVLAKGFEDAGRTLKGDVLNDEYIKKLCLYADTEYYTTFEQESYTLIALFGAYIESFPVQTIGSFPGTFSFSDPIINPTETAYRLLETVIINSPGKYRIIGLIRTRSFKYAQSKILIKYRDIILFETTVSNYISSVLTSINLVFETASDINPNFITVEVVCAFSNFAYTEIINLNINAIRLHDNSGTAIPTIINQNQVDLTRAVPDVTFGKLVTEICNWFNLDITPVGNDIYMNFIQNSHKNNPVLDLTNFEIKTPVRKFKRGSSFVLKFNDVDSEDYKYQKIFATKDSYAIDVYKTDDKTTEIPIDVLPLPVTFRNNVATAHGFGVDQSKIYAVLYDGLTDGLNLTKETSNILIPQIYLKHWKEWLSFRVNSQGFKWSFKANFEQIAQLNNKSRIHSYKLNHIVKSITRTEVSEDEFEIDIETESDI